MDFYPPAADVPALLRTAELLVRPLRASDVILDYDAVITSRAELLLHSAGSWPREGFTLQENLADLQRHEREHEERTAFTYTVMNATETECLGCIYIMPLEHTLEWAGSSAEQRASVGPYEAALRFWVRHSRLADDLDARLLEVLRAWFRTDWAFARVVCAARHAQERHIRLFEAAGMRRLYTLPHAVIYLLHESDDHAGALPTQGRAAPSGAQA